MLKDDCCRVVYHPLDVLVYVGVQQVVEVGVGVDAVSVTEIVHDDVGRLIGNLSQAVSFLAHGVGCVSFFSCLVRCCTWWQGT